MANRTAEFHTELELLPAAAQKSAHIRHSIAIEQFLMEGAYNKARCGCARSVPPRLAPCARRAPRRGGPRQVLAARAEVPDPLYGHFMELLMSTVRDEIGSCSEKAYRSLKLADAQRLLRLDTLAQAAAFAAQVHTPPPDGPPLAPQRQPLTAPPRCSHASRVLCPVTRSAGGPSTMAW